MNKRKKSKLFLFATLLIIGYFSYLLIGQEQLIHEKQSQLKAMNAKIEDEKDLNAELIKQKEQVSSTDYAEKVAREKLGLVKPGEKVFIDVTK